MEKLDVLNLKVGQLAEMKTFEEGFRGAWFRCKIRDISSIKNELLLEYYDFPDEEITWTKIYQVPPYGRKSKRIKKQIMVRPKYPLMYHKSEMPPINSISEVCVIIDGTWKVGDLVDWHEKDCYWSARVIEVLSDDKVQIEFPKDPAGEPGTDVAFCKDLRPSLDWSPADGWTLSTVVAVAFCKDLRPSLDWSPREGWTLSTVEGQISCSARLIFPSKQGMDSERNELQNAAASPLHASSTSHISVNSLAVPTERGTERQMSEQQKPVSSIVFEESLHSQEVKIDDDVVESVTGKASSSDSISTLHVQETKADATSEGLDYLNGSLPLNIMHEDTLDAPILDLEELANKIKWMKNVLETKTNQLHNNTR